MEGRWLKITVAISLVVNVFAIGAMAGLLLGPAIGLRGLAPPKNPMSVAAEKLTPDDRDGFRQTIFDANQASGPIALDAHLARREFIRLMTVEPFDRAAATAAMARARSDDEQVRAHLDEQVIAFAAKLSPAERAVLADGFRRGAMQRRAERPIPGPPPPPPEADGHS